MKIKLNDKITKIDPLSIVLAIAIMASSYLVYKQKQKVQIKAGIITSKTQLKG